ncbi:MAG: ubiquinol-cytochrome C chaperone [Rhodospirillaceae bacterium]|nr:ubiquinol-cytochrome C chaperone [Rhodospirillaceae bacterium]|tara:strand:+ start:12108 stop:12650 length:543 start_codon:yes stop_codon:yes gene_type:complete
MGIFRRKKPVDEAHALYVEIVRQARQPFLFEKYGAPDSVDGRFDMISLHLFLILRRLKADADRTSDLSQCLFDTMFADMDRSLREMGAGDLGVGRRVKAMATAFYGRLSAYEKAIAASDDAALTDAILRNIFREDESRGEDAQQIGRYVLWLEVELARFPLEELLDGAIRFPDISGLDNS